MRTSFLMVKAALGCALLLAGCGGGGDSTTPPPPTPTTYTIGGTVTGLATGASVVLQNNAGNNLTVSANGTFEFASPVNSGATYAVTVLTQPSTPAQTCTVTSGTGTASAKVTSVAVTCVTPPPATYTIGGTVSGLATGASVVLQNNTSNNLTVSANGGFTFATAITSGATYAVTVLTQPSTPAQTCVVANGSGTAAANVSNVAITCTTAPVPTYTIGGTVSGLAGGANVVLQNNAGNNLTVSANGTFTFSAAINSGATYLVTVLTQPSTPVQACAVSGGTGTASANVTNVVITCVTPVVPTYTIGGTVSGLAGGATVQLQNNGGDTLVVPANGAFTFATSVTSGGAYSVGVSTQPASPVQNCVVTSGTGTASAPVTNVVVTCTTMTFTVGGTVTGLATGGTVVLRNNGGNDLSVAANGGFVFTTPINSGATYAVTVLTHPTVPGPGQNCVVTGDSGTVAGANVATVTVTCSNTDSAAPTISSHTPLPTAIGSKVQGGVVTVTFSEAMLPSSVTSSSVTLTGPAGPVSGAVALSAGDTVATFTPTARIAFDAEYTVAVTTAVRDASNNPLAAGLTWKFSSGKSLAVGDYFSCARLPDGRVKCWGDNTYGQLGYEDTVNRGDGVGPATGTLVAVNLGTGRTAVAVAAADYVACAILDDGSAKCWGRNDLGQVGQGDTAGAKANIGDQASEMGDNLPAINFGAGRKAVEISVGQDFACARLDNATLKCWGDSSRGALGQPNATPLGVAPGDIAAAPAVVLGAGLTPVQISLGHYHACTILVNGGGDRLAKCWGDNNWGQVGNGGTDMVGNDPNELGDFLPAVNFGTGRSPQYVMATGGHTCALLDDASTKCWGLNTWGQVGLNVGSDSPIADTFVERRTCNGAGGPTRANACIGDQPNEMGDFLLPAIAATQTARLTSGFRHNCVVRTITLVVNCWGSNEEAQLGIGTGGTLGTSDSIKGDEAGDMTAFSPTPLKTARTIEELSGGGFQTCVVYTDAKINCWGSNLHGQLGRNETGNLVGEALADMGDNLVDVDLGT